MAGASDHLTARLIMLFFQSTAQLPKKIIFSLNQKNEEKRNQDMQELSDYLTAHPKKLLEVMNALTDQKQKITLLDCLLSHANNTLSKKGKKSELMSVVTPILLSAIEQAMSLPTINGEVLKQWTQLLASHPLPNIQNEAIQNTIHKIMQHLYQNKGSLTNSRTPEVLNLFQQQYALFNMLIRQGFLPDLEDRKKILIYLTQCFANQKAWLASDAPNYSSNLQFVLHESLRFLRQAP